MSAPLHAGIYTPPRQTHTSPKADIPLGRHLLGRPPGRHLPAQCMLGYTRPLHSACWDTPPVQCMLGYGQQVGGMHPTGMHSCHTCTFITATDRLKFYIIFSFLYSYLNQRLLNSLQNPFYFVDLTLQALVPHQLLHEASVSL